MSKAIINIPKALFLIIIPSLILSCSPLYYLPNTQTINFLGKKGDFNISGHLGFEHLEVQAAYAINNQFGLGLNGLHLIPGPDPTRSVNVNNYFEINGFYYKKLPDFWAFETSIMVGRGSVFERYSHTSSPTFSKLAVQSAIGINTKYFITAFSTKIASLDYLDSYTIQNDKSRFFVLEPAITLRTGLEHLKLQAQFQHSFNLSDRIFYQKESSLTLGLVISL